MIYVYYAKINSATESMRFKTRKNCQPIITISERERLTKQPGPQLKEAPKGPIPKL